MKARSAPSGPVTEREPVTTGARSMFAMLSSVVAEPLSAFEAVNVTDVTPACVKSGIQANEPIVFEPFGVNDAPAGRVEEVSDAIASASGSLADTSNATSAPSAPSITTGAVATGARSRLVTVISVVSVEAAAPACAVNEIE